MKKCLILISVVCLLVSMTACGKPPVETAPETTASQPAESTQPQSAPPTEETKSAEPETTAPETVSQEETQPDTAGWPDVVKLVKRKGDTTTAYLLADGRYMDRTDRVFLYDGEEAWMCGEEEWNLAVEEPAFTWERAVDRLLAQRPDIQVFEDSTSEYAEKYVFWIQEEITDFRYQELTMEVNEDGTLSCVAQKTLFSVDQLSPEDGVAVAFCLEGALPNRGIQYTDAEGAIHTFYLTISGMDDSLLVIPCTCG